MLVFLPRRCRSFCVKRSLPVCLARVGVARSVEARRVQLVKHGRSQTFVFAHHVIFTVGFAGILRFGRRRHDSGEFQLAPCSLTLVRLSMTTGQLPIFRAAILVV